MAFERILIVGCGNMAGAMLQGWLAAGIAPGTFTIVDPARPQVSAGAVALAAVPPQGDFDAIVLGVKPQLLDQVARQVAALAGDRTMILSILAGVELSVLGALFPAAAGHVRAMPNLAAALGKSPIALAQHGLDADQRGEVAELLAPLGSPEWVEESEFDLVTALVGSGPAFAYRFIDALGAAATRLGLAEDKARRLALAMVDGAAALASASPHDPGELARRVASPGGTTQAGLDALDREGALPQLLTETLRAARDRSAEMAAQARRDG